MVTVTRGSHCLKLKQSGGILLRVNGLRYALFPLFRAETKWNKLVACEWTPLRVVHTVWSGNEL